MDYKKEMLALRDKYIERAGSTSATLGKTIMNDGKFFDRIERGGSCTVETYHKVIAWFCSHTPARKRPKLSKSAKPRSPEGVTE